MTTIGGTGTSPTSERGVTRGFVSERVPIMDIVINKRNLRKEGYLDAVMRLMIEEKEGMINYAEMVFLNNNMNMANDDLFTPGAIAQIKTGYLNTSFEVRDYFELQNPMFRAAQSGIIVVKGYGTAIQSTREGKRRVFIDRTHSQIATQIANEYGWDTDIDATDQAYPRIMQAGKTDYQLLIELAELNGFEFYVEQDMLHFHGIREEPIEVEYWYLTKDGTTIQSADFTIESEGRAVTVAVSDYDPLEGRQFDVEGIPTGQSAIVKEDNGYVSWQSLAAVRKLFLIDQGQFLTQDEAQRFVDGYTQAGQYVVRARLKCNGNELIHPRKLINIRGVGRFNGAYYVKSVIHTIHRNTYTCDIECARAFVEKAIVTGQLVGNRNALDRPTSGGKDDVTEKSVSAGSVRT